MIVQPSESREELEKLERKHAENPEGRYFVPLANAYRKVGELDQAIDVLREGLEKHRDYLSAHIVLGRCLTDKGDTEAAEAEFRYVLTLDPQNLIALRTLGEIALADGKIDDAQRWYRELLTVDPMNEDARRALDGIQVIPSAAAASEHSVEHAAGSANALGASAVPGWEDRPQQPTRPTPQPVPPADEFDSIYGSVVQLDSGDDREGDGQQFGAEGQAVVTETIAELYTRQGFYSRAADVYRELIRRKGLTRELEERLQRVEELAAGQSKQQPPQRRDVPRPPAPRAESAESIEEPVLESAAPEPIEPQGATSDETALPIGYSGFEREIDTRESERAVPASGSLVEEMGSFVGSFLDGFTDIDRKAEPEPASAPAAEMPRPDPLELEHAHPTEQPFAGDEPITRFADVTGTETDQETIRDYLSSVLSWRPAAPGIDPEPTPPAAYAWSAPETAPSASVDDADLFPWELPEETPQATDIPEPTSEPVSVEDYGVRELTSAPGSPTWGDLLAEEEPTSGFGSSEPVQHPAESLPDRAATQLPRSEAAPAAEYAPPQTPSEPVEPSAPAAEVTREQVESAPAPAQPRPNEPGTRASEEDDLESFQAWLRSLKR